MIMIATAAVVWVFAVDASEMWYRYDKGPRDIGGWTHNGPYKTRAECDKARADMLAKPYAYKDDSHIVWHRPRECRAEDAAKVKALLDTEVEIMRRGMVPR